MGDLISRSELIKRIKGFTNISSEYFENPELLLDVIENQPTAYDVEKVVEELEQHLLVVEMEDEHIISESNVEEYFELDVVAMSDAIDIVRRGGVDERA